MAVIEITAENFEQEVMQSDKPVLGSVVRSLPDAFSSCG